MSKFFKSTTIQGIIGTLLPTIVMAILNPGPETTGAAVTAVVAAFWAIRGRKKATGPL